MHRYVFVAGILLALMPSGPSLAITAKEKMATCKIGADAQKLQGPARATFLKKCMSNKNDPRGTPAPKPPAAPGAPGAPGKSQG